MAGFLGAKPVILSTTAATVGGNMTVSGTSTLGDDVTITGGIDVDSVSDGTTSVPTGYVVNGSAKAYGHSNSTGTALSTTLNVSSLTDVAVGRRELNLTNALTATASPTFGQNEGGNTNAPYSTMSDVSTLRLYLYTAAGAYQDYSGGASALGDLA